MPSGAQAAIDRRAELHACPAPHTASRESIARVSVLSVEPQFFAAIIAIFLLAGLVKGMVGLGLPTVSVGLLVISVGLQPALALITLPTILTNVWQALVGGHARRVIRRTWPFMLASLASIWLGTLLLVVLDSRLVTIVLGLFVMLYALHGLTRPGLAISARHERRLGVAAGLVNGMVVGMTSSAMPGIVYLQALGLNREALIQAMGLMFVSTAAMLALMLGRHAILTPELALVSALGVIPAFAGMALGQRLRRRLPEARFRRLFFLALALMGLYLALRSGLSLWR